MKRLVSGAGLLLAIAAMLATQPSRYQTGEIACVLNIGMIDVDCNYQPHPHMGFPWWHVCCLGFQPIKQKLHVNVELDCHGCQSLSPSWDNFTFGYCITSCTDRRTPQKTNCQIYQIQIFKWSQQGLESVNAQCEHGETLANMLPIHPTSRSTCIVFLCYVCRLSQQTMEILILTATFPASLI